jgi:prepilin-type N-terminal cleavage/methylation domain-containing protein
MKKQAGFSLVEVLLALAVGGLVLMAASSLLVTIAQSWANRPATRDAFDAHVNGIAHFLTAVLEEATLPKEGSGGIDVVELSRPVGFSETDDPLIKFYLREAPPFFYWPHGLASRVHVYFQFEEGEGLYFLWYSELQELEKSDSGELQLEDEDQLFRSKISPYFHKVYYRYFGEEEETAFEEKYWLGPETELKENTESGKFRIPDFIQIVFRGDEEELRRTITLAVRKPAPSGIEEEPK